MSKLLDKQVSGLIVAAAAVLLVACDKTPIEPGNFTYPITLTTDVQGSVVYLSWDEIRVSTFEEYIIVRSSQPIDDTPEPEIDGFSAIAGRIDDLTVTTFEDSGAPIATEFYYKVYAKIGERFLYSQTAHVEIDLQLLSLRTDNFAVDTAANVIIGYDRSLRVLFTYNYQTEELIHQMALVYNSPIIRFGTYQGKGEIYICDRDNYIRILDRNTFQQWNQIFSSTNIHDFQYTDGKFIAVRNELSRGISVFERSTLSMSSHEDSHSQFHRLVAIGNGGAGPGVFEFGNTHIARFILNGSQITFDRILFENNSFSQSSVAYEPQRGHFAFSTSGTIYDEDLNTVASLDNGLVFHQQLAYAPGGGRLYSVGFELNTTVIRTYTPAEGYAFENKRNISFSPTLMFGDEGFMYAVGLAFINNTTRTVITKNAY